MNKVPGAEPTQFSRAARIRFRLATTVALLLGGCLASCNRNAVQAELHVYLPTPQDPKHLEIRAEVSGPQSNLYYIWFADSGKCDPQESSAPSTSFQFSPGNDQDWVTVEIWQRGKRVAQSRTEVRLPHDVKTAVDPSSPDLSVEITELPLAEPGGPNTRTNIAGRVNGRTRADYRVLIYARDDGVWYIQPTSHASHAIGPDRTWSSWTHTGTSYAALVVRSGYSSSRTLDSLPMVGGDVLCRTVMDGRVK